MMKAPVLVLLAGMAAAPAFAAPGGARPPGAQACIDNHYIDGHRAEDENTLVFTVGRRAYRNHLRSTCPGLMRLNSFSTLETEPQGSQLCEGDTVRVFDPQGVRAGGILSYPRCVLGWFEPMPVPPKKAKR